LRSALCCAYDTDTTLAMTGALFGQIFGAARIPAKLKDPIGDELVMGISYRRPESTLSALARDTARMGVLLTNELATGIHITGAPDLEPLPDYQLEPTRLRIEYLGRPAAAPGDIVKVRVHVEGAIEAERKLDIVTPDGWSTAPSSPTVGPRQRQAEFALSADGSGMSWPTRNIFTARLDGEPVAEKTFGIAGAALWRVLGVFFDTKPDTEEEISFQQIVNHHFVSLRKEYLPEADIDIAAENERFSKVLGIRGVVKSYSHEIEPEQLIGLQGAYCTYLARTVVSPEERQVHVVIGNNAPFRLYVNGEKIGEAEERMMWAPFNYTYRVTFREGANTILLKLLRYDEGFHFTLGLRPAKTEIELIAANCADWGVDMADAL
jgi:hypothetical protein